jgi:hypothetical protein
MARKYVFVLTPLFILASITAATVFSALSGARVSAQEEAAASGEVKSGGNGPEKAIISSAELMKLLVDPTYETLKDAVENPPQKRAEWRALYVAAFSLAELTNLMYSRGDKEFQHTPEWTAEAAKSQAIVTKLAESVRSQADYAVIKENYLELVKDCNACHEKFSKEEEIDEIVPPTSWGAAEGNAPSESIVQ